MMKNDLVEMANIPYRNNKARLYSAKCKIKNDQKRLIRSILLGIILGLLFGYFHYINVSASDLTDQDHINICYIARVVQAESGNQSDLGKRLVADTILNRMDSSDFPNNVKDVLEQDNQYATGIMADEDTIRLVMAEYIDRTNTEVLHFRTGYFHKWAVDMFQVGDHYFSK